MANHLWRMLAFVFFYDLTVAQWSRAGVSQSFTFVSSKYEESAVIYWRNQSTDLIIFQCMTFTNNCDPKTNDFYSANVTSNGSSFISVFTIRNVTPFQHKSVLNCTAEYKVNGSESNTYELNVFAAPENLTCNYQMPTPAKTMNFEINCLSQKVFPNGLCEFYIKTNATSERKENGPITYSHLKNQSTGYFTSNCAYTVSALNIGPGSHTFRVVMYPNITTNVTDEMKTTTEQKNHVEIYYPVASLGDNCQVNGYITENLTSYCTCLNIKKSILSTQTVWSKGLIHIGTNETLQFTAKRHDLFKCEISNDLNWTDTVNFTPNVSYPPDQISVNVNNQNFDFCNDKDVVVSGTCFVSESIPEPSVYITMNNVLTEIKSFSNNGEYIFNITMASPGSFKISCLANSTEYANAISNITRNVTINGPPDIPIIFKNTNNEKNDLPNNTLAVTKGETIICQSKGGYPVSKNISIKCGNEEIYAANHDQVSLTLNHTSPNNGTCDCIVWHESKCLQNRTSLQYKFVFSETSLVKDEDLEILYIGIGVAAGCIVALITLIFVIMILHQVRLKENSSGMADKLVNNDDLYFVNQEKSSIDMSFYPEYTNVVTTMESAMEAPKNLKHVTTKPPLLATSLPY